MLVGDSTVSGSDQKKIFVLNSSCTVVGAGTVGKAQAGPGRAGPVKSTQHRMLLGTWGRKRPEHTFVYSH